MVVTPVEEVRHRDEVLSMVLRASADEALCDATYLPVGMDAVAARAWLEACGELAWVVWADGEPCGFVGFDELRGSIGLQLGEGVMEREVWLEASWRGLGVIHAAMQLVVPSLRACGVRTVLGVAWEDNYAAVRGMERGGFTRLGRVWWEQAESEPGWCESWVLEL